MSYILKYYFNIIITSLRTTFKGFIPDKHSLVKSLLTTAVFWLILYCVDAPIINKITDAAILAIAVVLMFVFYGVGDLIATPAREDKKKSDEIQTLMNNLKSHTDRADLQRYFVSCANNFRDLERKLSEKKIDTDEYISSAKEGYEKIESDISNRPNKDALIYIIYDKSAANGIGPVAEPFVVTNLVRKLSIDEEKAAKVSDYLWYRHNLERLISDHFS